MTTLQFVTIPAPHPDRCRAALLLATFVGYALEQGGRASARWAFWLILVVGIVIAVWLPRWIG